MRRIQVLLWPLALRLARRGYLEKVDHVLLSAYRDGLIDSHALHVLDGWLKYEGAAKSMPRSSADSPRPVGRPPDTLGAIASVMRRGTAPPRSLRYFNALVALTVLWPQAMETRAQEGSEPPATVTVQAGAAASISDDSEVPIPTARIVADSPVYIGRAAVARLRATLALSGLPGDTEVDLTDVTTFRAVELHLEAMRRIGAGGDGGATYAFFRYGFASLFPGELEPRDRFARYYAGGLRFEWREGADVDRTLGIGYGRADIASPTRGLGQLVVDGHVRALTVKGVDVVIGGDVYLNLGREPPEGARDVRRLWVKVGL